MATDTLTIWTIGHSTRSLNEFLELLQAFAIEAVADVRRFPMSRRYPHFNKDALAQALAGAGIEYAHFPELGGRRRPNPDSPNTLWRNASFRAYADFTDTDEFRQGMERLLELARRKHTAIMCAEAVWWRCHRSLIADYLKAAGVRVCHILHGKKCEEHPYTSAARILDGKLSYSPGEQRI
ncbi:MAG TPA: DUF488 domain-containing protein [Gemmataceae bacterium]|jgi:uncharacterized protein (DUF488 family)|nr:DUF488 domain-containing protein [Gemmataceae bacterium]